MQLSNPTSKILHESHAPALEAYRKHGNTFPVTAEIDLTMRCSLDCKGCHSKWLHNPSELSAEQINRVLYQLQHHGCKSVVWSGGGEPLESPHWLHAMKEARHLGLSQGLYSYLPQLDQNRVNTLSHYCEFIYAHNNQRPVQKPPETKCVWTAGFLLDDKNWPRIREFYEKTNWELFDFCDFRPLIVSGADYSWAPKAIEAFEALERFDKLPRLRWASYKFYDLTRENRGRTYDKCRSTHFSISVGSKGEVWECLNRRGITNIGNLLEEDLETIWARKPQCREDLTSCRILCRGHEINKTLHSIFGPAPTHVEFA